MTIPSATTTQQNRTSDLSSQDKASTSGKVGISDRGSPSNADTEVLIPREGRSTEAGASPSLSLGEAYGVDAGAGRGSPLLDNYDTTARQSYAKAGVRWKTLDKNRRVRRFYQRFFTGVGVGGPLRFLTLTSSDEAVVKGYDIHKHFRALVMRLRRRWGRFEYMGVVEIKGDRHHLHLVFRGEYMAQAQVSAMWQALHASPIIDIQAVYKAKGGARYLAKYLAKEGVNRYWASYNWVFAGWVGWSRRVNRAVGHYPGRALLRSLAILDKVKRRLAMDFLEYQYPALWHATLDKVNGY